MEITFEQLKEVTGNTEKQKKEITFEELKSSVPETKTKQKTPRDVQGGFLGELFTGNTQRFGKTIGEALNAPSAAKKFSQVSRGFDETDFRLSQGINKAKTQGDRLVLLEALRKNRADRPKIEDFTGDVINKDTSTIIGEGLGTGVEALGGGVLTKGIGAVTKGSKLLPSIKSLAKTGATFGGAEGVASGLQEGGIKEGVSQGITGAGFGTALGAGAGVLSKPLSRLISKKKVNPEKLSGEILQGLPGEKKIGVQILRDIDTGGVKTYGDLTGSINKYIDDITQYKDKLLGKDKRTFNLDELSFSTGAGKDKVDFNYVQEGLAELYKNFNATNDFQSAKFIENLARKAQNEGLSLTDVELLARIHGKNLKGFNANGKLASGATKQAIENTRKGIKNTIRNLSNNKNLAEIDKQISSAIKVRKLSENMEKAVNRLQQRRKDAGFIAKAGAGVARLLNTLLGGSPSSIFKSLAFNTSPSRASQRTLNAIDLELGLKKNLKLLQKVNNSNDPTVIQKALQQLIKNVE
jgi:hypothetical protein